MNSAESQSIVDEQMRLPLACIDTQDEEFIIPLREYLESNGCRVVVNAPSERTVTYHIVAGDETFVKTIFAHTKELVARSMGIVIQSAPVDGAKLPSIDVKIVVVDPVYLTHEDVVEIFSFFFAGIDSILDKRRNVHELTAPSGAKELEATADLGEHVEVKSVPVEKENDISKQSIRQDIPHEGGASLMHEDDTKRIDSIMSDVFSHSEQAAGETKRKYRRRKIKRRALFFSLFIFFVILFPVVWYVVSLAVTSASFGLAGVRLKNGDVNGATEFEAVGNYWLNQGELSFQLISVGPKILGFDDAVRGQERVLSFLSDVSSSYGQIQDIVSSGKKLASTLLITGAPSASQSSPAYDIENLRTSVSTVTDTLGLARAQLSSLLRDATFPFMFNPVAAYGAKANQTLETIRGLLEYVDHFLSIYPLLAGFKNPTTYLLLLQNSNEMRPTGGFIGSVGLAKFGDGELSDFSIQDVFALDGQLKGHVDPPGPIRDLLGQEHWYLRDSNWDPDFKNSATRAAWFYEKESGNTVDGVFAINVPVVVDLLSATGPIYLPDYKDTITADNFFGKSFYYTQNNFFPGSTQKSDFLGTLSRALITKITSDKSISSITLFRALTNGLLRHDILFMFNDENLQSLVDHYGWSGRMFIDAGCSGVDQNACEFDPVAIPEANLSVSKVNYFVKHSVVREITLAPDGGISESLSLSLKNTADVLKNPNQQGIGGAYTTYLRFYLPIDSQVQDVTLDGQVIPSKNPKLKPPVPLPYIENTDAPAGVRSIGVAVSINPGVEHTIRISYKRGSPLSFGRGGATLDLKFYKHPGISDEQLTTVVHYPLYWGGTYQMVTQGADASGVSAGTLTSDGKTNDPLVAKEGEFEYNTTVLQDQMVRMQFAK